MTETEDKRIQELLAEGTPCCVWSANDEQDMRDMHSTGEPLTAEEIQQINARCKLIKEDPKYIELQSLLNKRNWERREAENKRRGEWREDGYYVPKDSSGWDDVR